MEPIDSLYFNWLCAKVIRYEVKTPSTSYDLLLSKLHDTEYIWVLIGDDNRAADGVQLRSDFMNTFMYEDEDVDLGWLHMGCSMLELLLALSVRLQFQTGINVDIWFWHLIENLGMTRFNDSAINDIYIDEILYNLMWRQYDSLGRGGLFPLLETNNDQTKVEIWYQMHEYLHADLKPSA